MIAPTSFAVTPDSRETADHPPYDQIKILVQGLPDHFSIKINGMERKGQNGFCITI